MRAHRFEIAGAIFSDQCDSLTDLRARGTLSGTPVLGAGPRGRPALILDGTDDWWIATAPSRSLTTSCTICCWCKWDTSAASAGFLWAKRGGTYKGPNIYVDNWFTPGDIFVQGGNDTYYDTGSNLENNTWTHLALVIDAGGTNATIYIDGTERYTVAIGAFNENSAQPFSIGARSDGWGKATGAVCDLMAFPWILSSAEILSIYNGSVWDYDRYLVSRWDMSEINPQDVGWAGNGNNGTGTNIAASDIEDGPFGGKSINLDGSTETISLDGSMACNTLATLVKHTSGLTEYIWDCRWPNPNWYMYVNAGTNIIGVQAGTIYIDGVAGTVLTPYKWSVITVTGVNSTILSAKTRYYNGVNAWFSGCVGTTAMWSNTFTALQVRDFYERLRRGRA
jgi:hypothetical protein